MKKILTSTLTYLVLTLTLGSVSAEDERNDFVSWEKPRISSVYNEAEKKLFFLVQFKTQNYTTQVYKYDFKITTGERSKSCRGDFTITGSNIYTICGILINDIKTLKQEYGFYLEVRDKITNNQETEFYRYFNSEIITNQDRKNNEQAEELMIVENTQTTVSEKNKINIRVESDAAKKSEQELNLDKKLNTFFMAIQNYSQERKLKIINKVIAVVEKITTQNNEKKVLLKQIKNRFLSEKIKIY